MAISEQARQRKNAYNRRWQKENREKVRAIKRIWEAANRDKLAEYRARQLEKDPRCVKDWGLKAKYGISIEQWDEMFERQAGKCAICASGEKELVVDHDHASGSVRSLLCRNCNTGIGLMGESPTALQGAIEYLDRWAKVFTGPDPKPVPTKKKPKKK